ncbi:MAG: N-acetylmuramoyl-L-alanine amidase [Flavobacteriales bacterium]|nr:N-acetylmuramoyl-L-alanine amidase [Flavobacteriales bacterium]
MIASRPFATLFSRPLARVFAASAAIIGLSASVPPPAEPVIVVMLDAGHGGKDPGNLGTGRYITSEKDITLAVTLKTKAYIEEHIPGVRVVLTRDGDTYPTLPERVAIASKEKADVFISIHCDSFKKSSAVGSSTFVMGLGKSEASLRVAAQENALLFEDPSYDKTDGFDPDDPDTFIALALRQNAYLDRSLKLAGLIQSQFRERVGRKDRGVRQAVYYVTAYTTMPSVLVELGFLTNPKEEDFLRSEQGQDYMASAIFRAFREYQGGWKDVEERKGEAVEANSTDALQPNAPNWHAQALSLCGSDVCFRVQIKSGPRTAISAFSDEKGATIPGVEELAGGNSWRYVVGSLKSYAEACRLRDTLRVNGYPDAFVTAYQAEQRIPLDQALSKKRN